MSSARTHGTLTKWNDDRGFGFITPANGNGDLFVHISAFPRDGVRPRLDELISFEVENAPDGKRRAVRIMRPGQRRQQRAPGIRMGEALTMVVLVAIGIYGVSVIKQRMAARNAIPAYAASQSEGSNIPAYPASQAEERDIPPYPVDQPRAKTSPYSCDGRTMCSQMKSCAEATYFIRNCPNTQMDGDGDGEPCESQWCK